MVHKQLFVLIIFIASCSSTDSSFDKLEKNVAAFSIHESELSKLLKEPPSPDNFGDLWVAANMFHASLNQDTLTVDVNVDLASIKNLRGGCRFSNDTLFLYANGINRANDEETSHSTLRYKIVPKGQTYKELKFIEL
jgi:hypothetical protein